jgi:subtilisin
MTGKPESIEACNIERQLILLKRGSGQAAAAILHNAIGARIASSKDWEYSPPANVSSTEGLLFEQLDAALIAGDPDQARALRKLAAAGDLIVEPERAVYGSGAIPGSRNELSGPPLAAMRAASWGLRATGVLASSYSGRGIRVAILDTGLDLRHPDFSHRKVRSRSFVAGLPVHDRNGHGTCCAGIAAGPRRPRRGSRYGVAFGADLYVARVLDDDAHGTDGNVLAGIDWAVRSRCAVVSISLGTPVGEGEGHSRVFERIAARALAAGSLLVAPAGNASQRPDRVAPVEHPANCPSVLAVGAVTQSLALASFSNGGLELRGGVDVTAPGTAVLSAAPRPTLYQVTSGTSVAAPFVAGIAALLAEASPQARGAALRALVLKSVRRLSGRAGRACVGVAHAP